MAKGQDTTELLTQEEEHDVSALLSASIKSGTNATKLPPEDAAWADSCFVSDSNVSDDSWNAMCEALLEALGSKDSASIETASDINGDREMMDDSTNDEPIPVGEKLELILISEAPGDEDSVKSPLYSPVEGMVSRDSIFKMWELEKVEDKDEDDESDLIKQLKKVLMGDKFKDPPSSDNDLSEVDELVAGMKDLSLTSPSE